MRGKVAIQAPSRIVLIKTITNAPFPAPASRRYCSLSPEQGSGDKTEGWVAARYRRQGGEGYEVGKLQSVRLLGGTVRQKYASRSCSQD